MSLYYLAVTVILRSTALALLPALLPAAIAQTPAPAFDAVAIRPSAPDAQSGGSGGGPGTNQPGRVILNATTLRAVIARAWSVQRFQIVGPPWFDDQRYDIQATVPRGATPQDF